MLRNVLVFVVMLSVAIPALALGRGTIIDDFLVNDDAGTTNQYIPAVAVDGSGNFLITWQDYRNGYWDIYAQRYNSSGTPIGSNFRVDDDAGTADQVNPATAMDGSGNFVITWQDYPVMVTEMSMLRDMTPQETR